MNAEALGGDHPLGAFDSNALSLINYPPSRWTTHIKGEVVQGENINENKVAANRANGLMIWVKMGLRTKA